MALKLRRNELSSDDFERELRRLPAYEQTMLFEVLETMMSEPQPVHANQYAHAYSAR